MNIAVLMPDNPVRHQFLPDKSITLLSDVGELCLNPSTDYYSANELRHVIHDAQVVVTGWGCPRINADILAPDIHPLLLVHMGGTVAPYVDETTFNLGIRVVCANEIFAKSVAEGTVAYILAGLRQIPYWNQQVHNGLWRQNVCNNHGLFGKKVGLTGFGTITRHLLPILKAFETEVYVYSSHMTEKECQTLGVRKASLEEIFSDCDVVSLHNALTERTYHMIGRDLLSLLKPNAVLVNTSRGAVLDEAALVEELKDGRFTAVLDVFETEPLSEKSPLRSMENAILIPHMGGPTSDLYERCGLEMIEEIRRFRDGKSLRYEVRESSLKYMTAKG